MKVAIPSSAGGHLTEILQIRKAYDKYDKFFITVKRKDTEDLAKTEKVYFVDDTGRSLAGLIKNIIQSAKVILSEKPNVVITTGAGAALPSCVFAKLFGAKLIYMESYCRVNSKSITGIILYPFADVFLVQWPGMAPKYGKKAQYWGGVF